MHRGKRPAMIWKISIDTGGTFTDAYAVDPDGGVHRIKILSSSTLRLPILSRSDDSVTIPLSKPSNFFAGFTLNGARVTASEAGRLSVRLAGSAGSVADLRTGEEAPVLAIRLLTDTPPGVEFPPLELRVGTTRGTNALLEHRGAPTVFFTTPGFEDLLTIGDQRRPDLFALQHYRPAPLQRETIEHGDLEKSVARAKQLRSQGITSAAIALKNSYLDPHPEQQLADALAPLGFDNVSVSSDLAPLI